MNRDPKQSGDHLDAFLKAGDPVEPKALSGDGVESALDEIGAEITGQSRQASPRRTRRLSMGKPRAALVIGFATIGIGAAVAGGSQLSARTGHFSMYPYYRPTPQEIAKASPEEAKRLVEAKRLAEYGDKVGPSEDLYPGAPDFREVALGLSFDIPFPKGYESWRDTLIADEIRMAEPNNVETSAALRGWLAMSAYCAWVLDWRHAKVVGDAQAATQAAQVISEAPSWKAVTDEDPHLDPAATGEDGKSIASLFGWMLPFRDAVLADDRTHVEHLLITEDQGGRCQDYDWDWRALDSAHAREWSGTERQQKYAQYLASRTS